MRSVSHIIKADKVNMGGIIIDQPLPNSVFETADPFLLIHHWYQDFPGDRRERELGVGPHPHRGFSPVTVIFEGALHHRDSLGNSSVVEKGGVQWMNAGKGITHSERPSRELAEKGGAFEIIQFWVNTPAEFKMQPAAYFPLSSEQIPHVLSEDGLARMNIIAGSYKGVHSSIPTHSPLLVASIFTSAQSTIELDLNVHHNVLLYQLDGKSEINGKKIGQKTLLQFGNDSGLIRIDSIESSRLLLLSGQSIEEKITSYGPFVMNSTTEIMEAIRDAQQGKMGILIEDFD